MFVTHMKQTMANAGGQCSNVKVKKQIWGGGGGLHIVNLRMD